MTNQPFWLKKTVAAITYSYTLCIIIGSLVKLQSLVPETANFSDKTLHLVGYTGLSFFWCIHYYFINYKEKNILQPLWKAMALSTLVGITMEALQYLCTSYRSLDILDIVANTIGVVLGGILFGIALQLWITLKKRSA